MNTIVTENNSNGSDGNSNNGRWTPFRGSIFKEFMKHGEGVMKLTKIL